MHVRSLLELDEIKNLQEGLENWQMVPLEIKINNCSPLLIKYDDQGTFEMMKEDPVIETIPFYIGMNYNSGISKMCYLFIKVYARDNTSYTLHEVAFNLQNSKQADDCKKVFATENHCVILVSPNDVAFINYDLPEHASYANSLFIDNLIKINVGSPDNYREAIDYLQTYKLDPESLLLWLSEISKEQHSSMIHINI